MPKPAWYRESKPDPRTSFTQVRISTHAGRLLMGHLTLEGKNWRNGRAPSQTTLMGYDPANHVNLDRDLPDWVMFIVYSYDAPIVARSRMTYEANLKIKDPRRHHNEWKWAEPKELNPIQQHHMRLLHSMITTGSGYWNRYPPYVNAQGEPPDYMQRNDRPAYDSGDDEMDE